MTPDMTVFLYHAKVFLIIAAFIPFGWTGMDLFCGHVTKLKASIFVVSMAALAGCIFLPSEQTLYEKRLYTTHPVGNILSVGPSGRESFIIATTTGRWESDKLPDFSAGSSLDIRTIGSGARRLCKTGSDECVAIY